MVQNDIDCFIDNLGSGFAVCAVELSRSLKTEIFFFFNLFILKKKDTYKNTQGSSCGKLLCVWQILTISYKSHPSRTLAVDQPLDRHIATYWTLDT